MQLIKTGNKYLIKEVLTEPGLNIDIESYYKTEQDSKLLIITAANNVNKQSHTIVVSLSPDYRHNAETMVSLIKKELVKEDVLVNIAKLSEIYQKGLRSLHDQLNSNKE